MGGVITSEYRALNADLHQRNPKYGSYGAKWAPRVRKMAESIGAVTILDYGAGKGTLAASLTDLNIRCYDPAVDRFSDLPEPADLVVCTDVLEHIEPANLDAVLAHIRSLTIKQAFFVVSLVPAGKTLRDGRNAHLLVKPWGWWWVRLSRFFVIGDVDLSQREAVVTVT